MDHLYRDEKPAVSLCGKLFCYEHDSYCWSLEYYKKKGVWKRDTLTYNWCEECLENITDLEYINNIEL